MPPPERQLKEVLVTCLKINVKAMESSNVDNTEKTNCPRRRN
jgi:hypothetical protein